LWLHNHTPTLTATRNIIPYLRNYERKKEIKKERKKERKKKNEVKVIAKLRKK